MYVFSLWCAHAPLSVLKLEISKDSPFLSSRKFLNFLVTLVDEIAVLKINLRMCTQLPWTGIVR